MLLVLPVRPAAEALIPAVSHFGTARLQTVYPETSPLMARLLEEVEERCGNPVVLNTSFNLKGEPIVASPEDALSTFLRSDLDMLVMGRHVVRKP